MMGLATQLVALGMLAVAPGAWLVVPYVMAAQALSGIAKDLTKMSSKSAVRLVAPAGAPDALFRWVAVLTGSKNALKGVGFFLGGLLLTVVGFRPALVVLMALVLTALVVVLALMRGALGSPDRTAKFAQMFSNNRAVNVLAAARVFLFARARRLVRRRPPGLPAQRARLELLAGRRIPRGLGDRLRHRAGRDARIARRGTGRNGDLPRRSRRHRSSRSRSRPSRPPWRSRCTRISTRRPS